tara:strand:- start:1045 stop:1449 length:405 start_codon:yes stop_codon:yes gene_type:complete
MFRRFSTINKPIVSITTNAWNKIISIAKSQNADGFLFFAESGGCNGFNYKLDLLSNSKLNNIFILNQHIPPTIFEKENVKLVIDPVSEMILLGTKIDYIVENYSKGYYENKFIFIPDKNLVSSCGCGISFNPKN